MSLYKVIVPNGEITNLQSNSSAETGITEFTQINATETITQNSARQKFGVYAVKVVTTTAADAEGTLYTQASAIIASTEYTLSVWARATGADFVVVLRARNQADAANLASASYTLEAGVWTKMQVTFTSDAGQTSLLWRVTSTETTARTFNIDGFDCVLGDTAYTHVDGDQPGCEWNGIPHASTSTLSALNRSGGVVRDFVSDYGLTIESFSGQSHPPLEMTASQFSTQAGGNISQSRDLMRFWTLSGLLDGSTIKDLHQKFKALTDAVDHSQYPLVSGRPQDAIFRYTGATTTKELAAQYSNGLEGRIVNSEPLNERMALNFVAQDPYWKQIGNSAAVLDLQDTATLRYITGRLRSTGQWDDLGLTNNPLSGGTIYAIAWNHIDKRYYVGGDFDNFNAQAGWDHLVAFDPSDGNFYQVGSDNEINGAVLAVKVLPNGDVIFGGSFTNAGDADGDYIAYYDLSADDILSLSPGGTGAVWEIEVDHNGNIWIGGGFDDWDSLGAGVGEGAVYFDGSDYVAIGTAGVNDDIGLATVYSIKINVNGDIYIGGNFDEVDSVDSHNIAKYSGGAWVGVGTAIGGEYGVDGTVYAIEPDGNGGMYLGGAFDNEYGVAGTAFDSAALWNGAQFLDLGGGVNSTVYAIRRAPNGTTYWGGLFTEAGGLDISDRIAIWNGSTWAHIDVDLPGTPTVRAIETADASNDNSNLFDTFVGFTTTGAGYFSGIVTATNAGNAPAYPIFKFENSDILPATGSQDYATLAVIRNEVNGKTLWMDYNLVASETLTIDLDPRNISITSNIREGDVNIFLDNSAWADFELRPGDNPISVYYIATGTPTLAGSVTWRNAWKGVDD